ncbi:Na/Pi cotransporter family protein [Ruegeria sediminis]|uniref:Na/Pi cotransporter family protein n=1 Tax=Ruegeria sediminis TaxID=2583820 RepID=A0ABY2X2S3_9RHOB|nr:Na/Pi cotransporter family protein [Ruegeria sediminis]TMV09134.1 Na/Pi cotransporter family protein [Ruegeria sediminis]
MAIIGFLISLTGATMLLLFAVRMVRTGIERSFGASFKRLLTQSRNSPGASATGLLLAIILQSSAAVALLVSGFMATGMIAFPTGLAIVLGGDLGSALIIQILSFRMDWLVPLLLTIGGWLFVKTEQKKWRQTGRILMGIAFILISLQFLRAAVEPIRDSAFLPAIAGYLARDFVTAFIVGATLAFVMHSSVAAILMCVTLAQIGAIPVAAGMSLILGANLGSAVIPIWLTRGMPAVSRRVPYANLLLRGTCAMVALLAIDLLNLDWQFSFAGPGQLLIYVHIAFNLSLLLLSLPFCSRLAAPVERMFPDKTVEQESDPLEQFKSALDESSRDNPKLAISSLKRELLRMVEMVERMFAPTLPLYENPDPKMAKAVRELDESVNRALEGVRLYVASLPITEMTKADSKTVRGLMDYAIRLESAGDVASKTLTRLAETMHKKNLKFTADGWNELVGMHEAILVNLKMACNVLISDDLESARLLVMEKTEIKRRERDSRKRHLKRLQDGEARSFETSNIHLETLRALRDFNSHISAIAYPILYENGQLLETRLILDMNQGETERS